MAGYWKTTTKIKMKKRKDLDEFNDDFSEFSLSSPARKIRRLDAELPPIMEEEESEIPAAADGDVAAVDRSYDRSKEERAIVLFKPVNTPPILHAPSNFAVSVDSNLISGFKNQFLWSSQSGHNLILPHDEATAMDNNNVATKGCLAVVPWVPSQLPAMPKGEPYQSENPEMMEAEEAEAATMEIEDNNVTSEIVQANANDFGGLQVQHWQQHHHCMTPQFPENTSTPISWFR